MIKTLSEENLTFANLSWKSGTFSGQTRSYLGKLLKERVLSDKEQRDSLNPAEVIQINNLYLICPKKDGIIVFDQHAVSERVLYEELLQIFKKEKEKKETVSLQKAFLLELSPSDSETLREYLNIFDDLGFIITEFGENTFKIETIPAIFKDWDIKSLIRETLDDLRQTGVLKEIDSQVKKMISYLACRLALKAGDKLNKQQCKKLLKK